MDNSLILLVCMVSLLIISLFISWLWERRKLAIKEVNERIDEQKLKDINEALNIYGFLFDLNQDIVYSSMYPYQRKFGYCSLYDELAPFIKYDYRLRAYLF